MKQIGEMWRQLTTIEKGDYEQKAKFEKEKYAAEVAQIPYGAVDDQPSGKKRRRMKKIKD